MSKNILDFVNGEYTLEDTYKFLLDNRDFETVPVILTLSKEKTNSSSGSKLINTCISQGWDLTVDEFNSIFERLPVEMKLGVLSRDHSERLTYDTIINFLNNNSPFENPVEIQIKNVINLSEEKLEYLSSLNCIFIITKKHEILNYTEEELFKMIPYINTKYLRNVHLRKLKYKKKSNSFYQGYTNTKACSPKFIKSHVLTIPRLFFILLTKETYSYDELYSMFDIYMNIEEIMVELEYKSELDRLISEYKKRQV